MLMGGTVNLSYQQQQPAQLLQRPGATIYNSSSRAGVGAGEAPQNLITNTYNLGLFNIRGNYSSKVHSSGRID